MNLSFVRTKHLADEVSIPDGYVEQRTLACGTKMCNGSLVEVTRIVEFVAVDFLPATGAPPARQTGAAVGDAGGQIAVFLLGSCNDGDDAVEIVVELGIVMCGERIGGTFYDLVGIGVVEREVAAMLTLLQSTGNGKIVEATVDFALVESRRDADGAVGLDARSPESIGNMYLREGNLLDGGCRLLIVGKGTCACRKSQKAHANGPCERPREVVCGLAFHAVAHFFVRRCYKFCRKSRHFLSKAMQLSSESVVISSKHEKFLFWMIVSVF